MSCQVQAAKFKLEVLYPLIYTKILSSSSPSSSRPCPWFLLLPSSIETIHTHNPLVEETHSSRSLPVSRVSRLLRLSRLQDGTVVDYFRLPLSLGGSTGALLQRAHAFAWSFGGEQCGWCANVVRDGSCLVVVVDCRLYWRGLGPLTRSSRQR
jgi:hypothetical protein